MTLFHLIFFVVVGVAPHSFFVIKRRYLPYPRHDFKKMIVYPTIPWLHFNVLFVIEWRFFLKRFTHSHQKDPILFWMVDVCWWYIYLSDAGRHNSLPRLRYFGGTFPLWSLMIQINKWMQGLVFRLYKSGEGGGNYLLRFMMLLLSTLYLLIW